MASLFLGFAGAHGTYGKEERSAVGKLEIKRSARTLREPVTLDLWKKHLSGERPLGIIPITEEAVAWWGAIDVDIYDLSHADIVGRLASEKLPLIVCKTKSGGAHIFLFLSEPAPAEEVSTVLRAIAARLGFGQSEIFPKQAKILVEKGDLGSWLNMPYFGGDESTRLGVKKTGGTMLLREFLSAAEAARTTIDTLSRARAKKATKAAAQPDFGGKFSLDDGPPCLQLLAEQGIPDGTRNNALMQFGVFAKKKFGTNWREALDEYNQLFCDPPLSSEEVSDLAKSLDKKDYNYQCKAEPICSRCDSVLCRTRKHGVGWSDDFPVISGISVLTSDPPVWFLDVNSDRLELTTDDVMNYKRFQAVCMERLFTPYLNLKQDTWLKMVRDATNSLTVIEAPPDTGIRGSFVELLQDFLTNRQRGERREDILSGKPWQDDETGVHWFQLRHLHQHLDRAGFKGYTRGVMVSRLKELGGKDAFFNIGGNGRNVWGVPKEAFEIPESPPPRQPPEDPV